MYSLSFRNFLERSEAPRRPDEKSDSDVPNMRSIDFTANQLGIDKKDFESVPFVGADFSFSKDKILGGLSSYDVKFDGNNVILTLRDESPQRYIRTPSGMLAKDPSKASTPKQIVMSYDQFINKMWDPQYSGSGGAMGGSPGAMIPGL